MCSSRSVLLQRIFSEDRRLDETTDSHSVSLKQKETHASNGDVLMSRRRRRRRERNERNEREREKRQNWRTHLSTSFVSSWTSQGASLFCSRKNLSQRLTRRVHDRFLPSFVLLDLTMNSSQTYYSHETLTRWVSTTISPLILLGCAVGNMISFLVLLRPRLRRQTTSIYLAVLCVAEMGTCYTGLLRQFLLDAFKMDIRTLHPLSCRTHIYFTYVFLRLAPLLLAIVTLQRYVYVSQHLICSIKSTYIQLASVFLFVALAEFHLFAFYDLTYSDTRPRTSEVPFECTVDKLRYPGYYKFRTTIYPKLTLFLYTVIPLAIIIIGNLSIIRQVHQASKRSRSSTRKKRSVTRMLYAVSVLYTVLTTPASIFLAIVPASYQLAPAFRLQWTLLRLLFYLCHSVNFLLFCASGTFFRQEFSAFLRSKCGIEIQCGRPRRARPSNTLVGLSKCDDETFNHSTRSRKPTQKPVTRNEHVNHLLSDKLPTFDQTVPVWWWWWLLFLSLFFFYSNRNHRLIKMNFLVIEFQGRECLPKGSCAKLGSSQLSFPSMSQDDGIHPSSHYSCDCSTLWLERGVWGRRSIRSRRWNVDVEDCYPPSVACLVRSIPDSFRTDALLRGKRCVERQSTVKSLPQCIVWTM